MKSLNSALLSASNLLKTFGTASWSSKTSFLERSTETGTRSSIENRQILCPFDGLWSRNLAEAIVRELRNQV
ncbi:MAG TPA: hypothetical protein V6C84_09130 [Coleofasciculaceae cyanobacterium]